MIKKKTQIPEDSRLSQIGNRVRALRKANTNFSAEDFANEKGFDRVQYSRIENGANITMKTLLKVVDAHNMTLKEFFNDLD
jgi:transcriptional regulator with XRE-family HTH domain